MTKNVLSEIRSVRTFTDMARLITWIDGSSAERQSLPSAKAMHRAGRSVSSWCSALVTRVKCFCAHCVPVGYQDDNGFHYGQEIVEEQNNS